MNQMMKLYNTLTREKEIFKPIKENRVKMFVCGPTVYDHSHIGHARTYISFDMIARYLKYKGFSVFYLQNVTDIDDKILKRAKESSSDPQELARKFEEKYTEDMKVLGVENVNLYARATDHIPEIIQQIETLLSKGFAYETENGVYFDESKFSEFGKLSNRRIEDLNVHRISPDSSKRNPGDFVLWKKKDDEPFWDSPWGSGRPGWHIEDTAISEEYFGPQYDIHGGGLDLIFPHHEAEIAQMESASGKKPMVRYWMHTGFLNVMGEKMSKSLGNFITIKDLLQEYSPEVFRFFVLSTHYRSPIDFSDEIVKQSQTSLNRIYKLLGILEELIQSDIETSTENDNYWENRVQKTKETFLEAMDNDFNTPMALSILFDFIRDVNRDLNQHKISKKSLKHSQELIKEFGDILGLNFSGKNSTKYDRHNEEALLKLIVDIRTKIREKQDYELSDEIRSRLNDLRIILEDR